MERTVHGVTFKVEGAGCAPGSDEADAVVMTGDDRFRGLEELVDVGDPGAELAQLAIGGHQLAALEGLAHHRPALQQDHPGPSLGGVGGGHRARRTSSHDRHVVVESGG